MDDPDAATSLIPETLLRNDLSRNVVALARECDADRCDPRCTAYHLDLRSRGGGYCEYDGDTDEISTRELEGVSLEAYAEDHTELATALEKWGAETPR